MIDETNTLDRLSLSSRPDADIEKKDSKVDPIA